MNLALDDSYSIADIVPADKPAYLEYLREREISEQTLAIPYPYTEADADDWIRRVAAETTARGRSMNWAIRRDDGRLIGGIGFLGVEVGRSHRGEVGYWLAKPYWGKGIMTEAVRRVSMYAFEEFGLVRIQAHVFHFNAASARVLEKAGYSLEGRLRAFHKKNGVLIDSLLYARMRPV